MASRGQARLLFRNTMVITDGKLDEYRKAVEFAVRFVEEHGPQSLVDVFIDEEDMRAYSYQLYADSESVLEHWQLSDPYIRDVMKYCTVERFDVYGQPSQEVLEHLQSSDYGYDVTFYNRLVGFTGVKASS